MTANSYKGDNKSTSTLSKNDKPLMVGILSGVLLFFIINLLGEGLKGSLKAIMSNVNMSSPINMSALFVIPMGIVGAIMVSVLSVWFINKSDYLLFSLISSIAGFCIEMLFKSGGPIGLLLILQSRPQYFVFMVFAFFTVYTTAFIVMLISLRVMNKIFLMKDKARKYYNSRHFT